MLVVSKILSAVRRETDRQRKGGDLALVCQQFVGMAMRANDRQPDEIDGVYVKWQIPWRGEVTV